MSDQAIASYVGQVERDPAGLLWAVLYCGADQITREHVPTLRRGRRRVADLVLGTADDFPFAPAIPAPKPLNRLARQWVPTHRRRHLPAVRRPGLLAAAAYDSAVPGLGAFEAFPAPAMPN